ncbi:hypothetical protein BJY04DRAFT_211876 [Aspergillus karnatakaensis]|uniref:uncharacterized protein n=1 Tax=Aspergillus karnatakaensis TaxID=1810916 RepID=UPI003CCCB125
MVSPEVFWPLGAAEDSETTLPYWPNLTNYTISLSGTTPAGEWLFEEDPDADEEIDEPYEFPNTWQDLLQRLWPAAEDRNAYLFRRKATPALLRDIYVSAGRAAQRMPRLQHMAIKCFDCRFAMHDFDYIFDKVKSELEEEVFRVWRDAAFQHTGFENRVQFGWKTNVTVEPIG